MTWHKIKIDACDKLFSKIIRERDKHCIRCGKVDNLQCSHYWGRRMESVRFDLQNADTLCPSCHDRWEHQKEIRILNKVVMGEYALWKIKQLGQNGYNLLKLRAHTFKKKDRKMEMIRLKEYQTNKAA